jgi:hypothetical protein
MDCWAASLGNCKGKLSREHVISDGIFDRENVVAFGFPWCKTTNELLAGQHGLLDQRLPALGRPPALRCCNQPPP